MGSRAFLLLICLLAAVAGGSFLFLQKQKDVETIGYVDQPNSSVVHRSAMQVFGWAVDRDGIASVTVTLNGVTMPATYGLKRRDIGKTYPDYPDSQLSGFFHTARLTEGQHTLEVTATDKKGNQKILLSRTISHPKRDDRWKELLEERGDSNDLFHILFATSGVSGVVTDKNGTRAISAKPNSVADIPAQYGPLNSATIKAGFRTAVLFMRTTKGREKDWVFDPDFNPMGPKCNGKIIAEDSLNGVLATAIKYKTPVLLTLNGGVWADAGCDAPEWDIGDELEKDKKNCQWNNKDEVMADNFLKTLPGSMAAPELARSLTFNVYADQYRHYKKRNIQDAARRIAQFAQKHPDLFAGITLEPDLYINPFVEGEVEKQWYDYNPDTIKQFQHWLAGTGPYAGEGPQDLRAYAREKPLTLEEVNKFSGKTFTNWQEVAPPREFPRFPVGYWAGDRWVNEWVVFRRHLVDWHYDEMSRWVEEAGIPSRMIFTAQGFQAPQDSSMPLANHVTSPVKNYDDAGVSIEGSAPTHGHLGAIVYGQSALNDIAMEGKESLFAMFRKVDPDWAIVEHNTSTYNAPQTLAGFDKGYRTMREMFNYDARYVSPMAWNGSNGLFADDPAFSAYTAIRNTPLEEAMQEFMASHANLPRRALYWGFGTVMLAEDDGWKVQEGGEGVAENGALKLIPSGERLVLMSPLAYSFPKAQHDLLILGTTPEWVKAVKVEAVMEDSTVDLAPKTEATKLTFTKAGLEIPLVWPEAKGEVKQVRLILYPNAVSEPWLMDYVVFYPTRKAAD